MSKKLTTKEFIEKAKKVWKDKYDYSKVDYTNNHTFITIICREHGEFKQIPNSHLQGHGCPKCRASYISSILRDSQQDFINKGNKKYNFRYDYSKVVYKGNAEEVEIICPIHGSFYQTPHTHLNKGVKVGCPKCAKDVYSESLSYSTKDFIKKAKTIHGNAYDYSLVNYTRSNCEVQVKCNKCGNIFWQKANSHLQGHGCPYCKDSLGERKIVEILKMKNIKFISQYIFNDCRDKLPLPFDFYLPDYNVCIEYDGIQHFEEITYFGGRKGLEYTQKHDKIKTDYCKKNNIKLLRIKYTEDIEDRLNQFLYNKCRIKPQSIFDLS